MDTKIRELIDLTKTKLGLNNYYLHTHKLYRNVNLFNETIYTLSMEWFPNHITEREDEDYNPEGTAAIDINVHSHQFESIIFVGGKSYANGITFRNFDTNDIIKWIENETGLTYREQFQLSKEEEGELQFRECIDGVKVSPSGYIEIKFDEERSLTLFSVNGHFPSKELVTKEKFSLTHQDIEPQAREQLRLIKIPSFEQEKLIPVYGIEEIYVSNDQTSIIPFEPIVDIRSHLKIDKIMYWEAPLNEPFEEIEISLSEEVTHEQAFSGDPHPDSFPITEMEQKQCIDSVVDFLCQVYPNDSGKWELKSLHRDKGYIFATLKQHIQDKNNHVFQRKIQVFLDGKSLKALNYMDNAPLLEMFQNFQDSDNIIIKKEEAYETLREMIELAPVYVYDFEQKKYRLCGKIDCQYAIHAATGEVVLLDDL